MSIKRLQQLNFSMDNVKKVIEMMKNKTMNSKDQKKYEGFVVSNNILFYKPLGLTVIPKDDAKLKQETLEDIYKSPESLGKGINQLHSYVLQHYLGIIKKDVIEFLGRTPEYQMGRSKHRIISKGIQSTRPLQWWSIDLVDLNPYLNANKGYRYIFSCLDLFTNYAWYIPIKHKTPEDCVEAFQQILDYNLHFYTQSNVRGLKQKNKSYDYPNYVVSDQGSEFKGSLDNFFKKHKINHKRTSSYSPQPNIEQSNGHLRQIMRSNFIRTNSLAWYPYTKDFEKAKNSNRLKKTDETPLTLMEEYFDGNKDIIKEVSNKIKAKNEARFLKHHRQEDIKVGDKVRVKMTAYQSELRKQVKTGNQKLVVVRFSPEIYTIEAVNAIKVNKFGYPYYNLKDNQNRVIVLKSGNARPFNSGDLLKISNDTSESVIDLRRANFLNRVKGNEIYVDPYVDIPDPHSNDIEDEPLEPVVEKIPKTAKDWSNALKGKQFTDDDTIRYEVVEIFYDRSFKTYVASFVKFGDKNISANRNSQSLKELLELSTGEDWFSPLYLEYAG
jgi:hypothetical protein